MKELLAEFVSYLASEKGLARNTIVAYSQDLEHFFLCSKNVELVTSLQSRKGK